MILHSKLSKTTICVKTRKNNRALRKKLLSAFLRSALTEGKSQRCNTCTATTLGEVGTQGESVCLNGH